MRLDHLLSREPILLGSNHGVRPVGGGLVCFLVPACVYCLMWVVGVGAFFGLGIKSYASGHTVGFTFNTV